MFPSSLTSLLEALRSSLLITSQSTQLDLIELIINGTTSTRWYMAPIKKTLYGILVNGLVNIFAQMKEVVYLTLPPNWVMQSGLTLKSRKAN